MSPGGPREQFDNAVRAFWRDIGPASTACAGGYDFDRDPDRVFAAYTASFRRVKVSGARLLVWSEAVGDKAAAERCRRAIADCINRNRELARRIREAQAGFAGWQDGGRVYEGDSSGNAQESPGEGPGNAGSHAHGQWESRAGNESGTHNRSSNGRRSANEDEENTRRYREQMEETARKEARRRAREQAEREARERRWAEEWEEWVRARQQEQQARDDEQRRAFEERAWRRARREQQRRQRTVWAQRVYAGLVILFLSLGFGGVISDLTHKPQTQPYLAFQNPSN